jgi:hypothetical protein
VTDAVERAAELNPERFIRLRTACGDQDEDSPIDLNEHCAQIVLALNGRRDAMSLPPTVSLRFQEPA